METRKNKYLKFRVTPKEVTIIETMAELEGRNLSEMARECIREAAIRRGISTGFINLLAGKEQDKVTA